MNIFSRLFLTAIFLFVSSHAVTAAGPETCTLVKPPTTPTELIENVKCVVALNIISDDDLLTNDKKLTELFGGNQFDRDYVERQRKQSLSITNFPPSINLPGKYDDRLPRHLSITIERILLKPGNSIETHFEIKPGNGLHLTFEDIVKLFSSDWKPHDNSRMIYEPLHPSVAPFSATGGHAYQQIDYILKTQPGYQAKGVISFDHTSMFYSLEIILNRRI